MYGPPGTGKTLLARACAAQTDATFLKLAGPQLVQMFIGDGAKLVRDCFALAKEKAPSIIFIDELDAVGTKRFDSDKSGDREVQRTMLELLNQLDGFASDDRIKVLAATNRVDVLDPALLRSGRLDRKIEFPLPNEESRAQILRIHSRKMTVDDAVNWPELARSTDEFGGAMLKAVCVEAGMIALRSGQSKISHEHYVDAIAEVQSKKKESYVGTLSAAILLVNANCLQHFHLRVDTPLPPPLGPEGAPLCSYRPIHSLYPSPNGSQLSLRTIYESSSLVSDTTMIEITQVCLCCYVSSAVNTRRRWPLVQTV